MHIHIFFIFFFQSYALLFIKSWYHITCVKLLAPIHTYVAWKPKWTANSFRVFHLNKSVLAGHSGKIYADFLHHRGKSVALATWHLSKTISSLRMLTKRNIYDKIKEQNKALSVCCTFYIRLSLKIFGNCHMISCA